MKLNGSKENLYKILLAKEQRAERQRELIDFYKCCLISFTLNIPGENKNDAAFNKVYIEGIKEIESLLKNNCIEIVYKEERQSAAGFESFICSGGNELFIKKFMVELEETHRYGRLFDIDVLNSRGEQISRRILNVKPRRCLVCDEAAVICVRKRAHSLDEIYSKLNNILSEEK